MDLGHILGVKNFHWEVKNGAKFVFIWALYRSASFSIFNEDTLYTSPTLGTELQSDL